MATHNYQPGYPLNLEPGSTDNERSLFQKIKAEFERLYRLLNSGLSYIDQLATSIDAKIADFENRANTLFNQLRQMTAELESRLDDYDDIIKAWVEQRLNSALTSILSRLSALEQRPTGTILDITSNLTGSQQRYTEYTIPCKCVVYYQCEVWDSTDSRWGGGEGMKIFNKNQKIKAPTLLGVDETSEVIVQSAILIGF